MDIIVKVSTERKCAASVDWTKKYTKAILSFGDKETPETDVEIEFTPEQLEQLGCVVGPAIVAGNIGRDRAKAKKAGKPYHAGLC